MKVALGISGGVDSAVAASLLAERGAEITGVFMEVGHPGVDGEREKARMVAERLGFRFEVFDLRDVFSSKVLAEVRAEYPAGRTPNPCISCNEFVKFGALPRLAAERLGCEMFATGHYARTVLSPSGVRLLRAVDRTKDQSYFLYRVPRDVLSRCIFPLGGLTKKEVLEIASARGLAFTAGDGESQDFCFGDVKDIVVDSGLPGPIVTTDGKRIGTHRGVSSYTVGMRRGLGIGGGGKVYYVKAIKGDTLVVASREECISRALVLSSEVGSTSRELPVKVRSTGEPRLLSDGVFGAAPGQSAVFYDGEEVAGGGIIESALQFA